MNSRTAEIKLTWQELLERYLAFKSLRKQSCDNYKRYISYFTHFFENDFADIQNIDCEKVSEFRRYILQTRQCKSVTWNSYCRHFKALMKFAIEQNLLDQKKIRSTVC